MATDSARGGPTDSNIGAVGGDEFYTADELCKRLKVGRATVYRMARDGDLPSVRIGNQLVRFPAREVDAVLDGTRRDRAGDVA